MVATPTVVTTLTKKHFPYEYAPSDLSDPHFQVVAQGSELTHFHFLNQYPHPQVATHPLTILALIKACSR